MTSSALQNYFLTNYTLNCPPTTYLRSYEFFALSIHILSPFSLILGIYGIFLVIAATPKPMESAKWFILHLHITTFYIEIVINILLVPFIFLPSGAVYSRGVMMRIGFPFKWSCLIGHQSFTLYSIAIVMLFENRHSQVTTIKYRMTRKPTKFIFYTMQYLIALPVMAIPYFETIDSDAAKLKILESIPCPEPHFFSENTHVLVTNIQMVYLSEAALAHCFTGVTLFFALQSGYHLLKKPNFNISERTRSLQKRFFFSLVVQLLIPFLVLIVPLFLFYITLANGIVEQFLSSLIIIAFSVHGIASSITLILLHKPYRRYTWDMTIGLCWREPASKPSLSNSFRPAVISTM